MTPDAEEIREEFLQLDRELRRHDRLYYGDANPEIADDEYDRLRRRWKELQRKYVFLQSLATGNSVGDDRRRGFRKVRHLLPMLSLDNTYNSEELRHFVDRLERILRGELRFSIEPKIDGAAVTLIYRHGKLAYGLSRGNGEEGDDVTQNLKTIAELPLQLADENPPELIEIRGEIYLNRRDFQRINEMRQEDGLEPFANGRNLAAGTLKLLDSQLAKSRHLRFIAYEIGQSTRHFSSHSALFETLRNWGISTNFHCVASGFSEIWQAVDALDQRRKTYDFDTDGAVIKLEDRRLREEIGALATAPRWAIAYKYTPERAKTRIAHIKLQVGRTGIIAPVAQLAPVHLAGSTVRHATLHNADEIARKDIRIGDSVLIEKAGEIIPAIVEVVLAERLPQSQSFSYPAICPACGNPLVRIDGEVAYRCLNSDCPPQIRRRMLHFASKSAMDINSLGEKMIELLLSAGMIRHFGDIFRLQKAPLMDLPRIQEKSAERLLQGIESAKFRPLWRLLHGLGIPHIGVQTAKILCGRWHSMAALCRCDESQLKSQEGIGEMMAASIVRFFQSAAMQTLLEDLQSAGVSMEDRPAAISPKNIENDPIGGNFFAISGSFEGLTREQLREFLESCGGKVRSQVSKNTDFLLLGNDPGSKLAEARELGVQILNAEDIRDWINRAKVLNHD